jgi:thiamine biosynthesis lipoprotein
MEEGALPHSFSYESMGTTWKVTLWDDLTQSQKEKIEHEVVTKTKHFDQTFSRFIPTSLISMLAEKTGVVEVPSDLVAMLRLYRSLYTPSMQKLNPLIGHTISDLGYDKEYSLTPKTQIRPTPQFLETLKIVDDTHVDLREPVLIDLGALGKGYMVDRIVDILRNEGIEEFLVDGSGDIAYQRMHGVIRAGLEDPEDSSKVIGVIELRGKGAFCASSGARRRWRGYHHTIDPETLTSPTDVLSTWVTADSAALADALATCLFFTPEENFRPAHEFESCIMKNGRRMMSSSGFQAQFF